MIERLMRLATLLVLLTGLAVVSAASTDQPAIDSAAKAVADAAPRAQADPAHPIFHVAAPAQWMNDPNGPIFYQGWYHLFYQLTPFSDESGVKYWGHVRSRDLAKWEPLPIAIAPSSDRGEESIWSGCCTVNGQGWPMIFYTSIGRGRSPFDHAEQWAAMGDDALIHWEKLSSNPVLPEAVNGPVKIYDWRDPFIFHSHNETFLVAGGHLAKSGDAAVNLYESADVALTNWIYRGVLFHLHEAPTAECPNFFQLGNKWVLLVSPYGRVRYFIGDFDESAGRFIARTNGLLDYGPNFYAPNTMLVPDGRRLVWGWVNGFPGGHGWNGCLSLPRQLSLTRDGQIRQMPAPQLEKLRGKELKQRNLPLADGAVFVLPPTNTLEIAAEMDLKQAVKLDWEITGGVGKSSSITGSFEGDKLRVQDAIAPLELEAPARTLKLRIFIDRSVLEVFANDTVCITQTMPALASDLTLSLHAVGGEATAKSIQAWPLKSIW